MSASIEAVVAEYYSRAVAEHGPTPKGADWSSADSQTLRFDTLLDGVDWSTRPTLLDFGCGYGALAAHLDAKGVACQYVGYDIAPAMVELARRLHSGRDDRAFATRLADLEPADVVVASGVFNVKLSTSATDWAGYVHATLGTLAALARQRLAFNMLPPASDPTLARDDLYYAEPEAVAASLEEFGGTTTLRGDYGLWEFTAVVTWDGD